PIVHEPDEHDGLDTGQLIDLLKEEGLNVSKSPYGLLHGLKLFAEGFDMFTRNRGPLGGDYQGYKEGDFPVTEDVYKRLIFLPMLSDPVPGAAERVGDMLEQAIRRAVEA
ncbi:MAG TPA: hypothetical protein VKA68_06115, partial [bacterium]|nr:hypothetical protein [bacterium]